MNSGKRNPEGFCGAEDGTEDAHPLERARADYRGRLETLTDMVAVAVDAGIAAEDRNSTAETGSNGRDSFLAAGNMRGRASPDRGWGRRPGGESANRGTAASAEEEPFRDGLGRSRRRLLPFVVAGMLSGLVAALLALALLSAGG